MGLQFEILEHIGILSSSENWRVEINLISWNGNHAKYDIRPWNQGHSKCGKGITLSAEELARLKELLKNKSLL